MKKETMCVRYFFVSLSNWGVGSMASMERSIAAHFVDGTRLYVSDFRVDGSGGNQRVLRFEAALTKPNGAANDRTVGVDASSKPVSLAQPRPLAIKDGKPPMADSSFSRVARYDAAAAAFKQDPEWSMGNVNGRFTYHEMSDMTGDLQTGKFFFCWRRGGIEQRFTSAAAFRDYDVRIEYSGAMICLSMSKRMQARITR